MRNTSKLMYRIGRIFNKICLIVSIILIVVGVIVAIVGGVKVGTEGGSAEDVAAAIVSGLGTSIYGVFLLVGSILSLIFVGRAMVELADESTTNKGPFIMTIIFGAIGENPFYILAGIFGIIAESNQDPNVVDAQPVDEPKDEQ